MIKDMHICYDDPIEHDIPERNLWFAVIERAVKDYCFFFDKLLNTGNGQLVSYKSLTPDSMSDFHARAICEFTRLRWFLFAKEPKEFNLAYLTEQLYDDGEGTAASIRKEVSKQFKLHFADAVKRDQFVAVIDYIKTNTTISF
jgi:hypothetical protein